jgi:hypothetical protein
MVPPLVDHGWTGAISYQLQEIMDLGSRQSSRTTLRLPINRVIRNFRVAAPPVQGAFAEEAA